MPSGLAPHTFKSGQSGNPGSKGGTYYEARRICREAWPDAARKMVELMGDPDPRIALMAADKATPLNYSRSQIRSTAANSR